MRWRAASAAIVVSAARLVKGEAGNIAGGGKPGRYRAAWPRLGALLLAAAFRQRSFSPVFVFRQRLGYSFAAITLIRT
jgi:hypothetical protein